MWLTIGIAIALVFAGTALAYEREPLLIIDDQVYTGDDFKEWWLHWQEKDMPFPPTPDPYIDWLLMVREASRMELDERPTYRHKIDTFLKARSLMLLKRDEIDDKIRVTAQEMEAEYRRNYAPRWQVVILYFRNRTQAAKVSADLGNGAMSVAEAIAMSGTEAGPLTHLQRWVRPKDTPLPWQEVLNTLKIGQASDPVAGDHGNGSVVFSLMARQDGDEQDYATVRTGIERLLRKRAQAQLTRDLIERLKSKYHVRIDHALMARIDPDAPDEALLERFVITTNVVNVTVRYFLGQLRKWQAASRSPQARGASLEQEKEMVVNQMIGNSLTVIEALDRHYEKSPALRSAFEFYRNHRLLKELEQGIMADASTVTGEEIASYYDSHPDDYLQPASVRYLLLQGDKAVMQKVWGAMLGGAEVEDVVASFNLTDPMDSYSILTQLKPELLSVVKTLGVDEISQPFAFHGKSALIKMLARKAAVMPPLENVADQVAARLKAEKEARAKGAYLARLKNKGVITVNEKTWQRLLTQMQGDGEAM